MPIIIPAINVENFDEVVHRIRLAEGVAGWVHIDVADGTFTPHAVWNDARDLQSVTTPLKIEIHFMVREPEKKIDPWLASNASRIIVHLEATGRPQTLLDRCHNAGKEAGLAICPGTPWEGFRPYFGKADILQTLAVEPGPSGQAFDESTVATIINLRRNVPSGILEVDGGITGAVGRRLKGAGADLLVIGSALYETSLPFAEALRKLNHEIMA